MIAHIWRGRTRAEDRHDFTSLLRAQMQAGLASSNACRGAYVLQRQIESGQVESLVLTLYDQRSLGSAGRGESFALPLISDREARFLVGSDPVPERYEVIIDPRRALLYADLRRRFPSRIVALR